MCSEDGMNGCGFVGKVIIITFAIIGIILSSIAAQGCRFLYFQNNSGAVSDELYTPFEGVTEGYVGIFNYEISEINFAGVGEECANYDSEFDAKFEVLITSQILAVVSPCFAAIALLLTIFDTFLVHYLGCFVFAAFMFLVSSATQAGTFALYAEPTFCIDAPHDCSVGSAGIQSAIAAVIYWLCCVFTCCFPRPDPFCDFRKKRQEDQEKVVVVNRRVIVEPDVQQGYNAEEEPSTPTKKKKKRKKKKKEPKSNRDKITDEDFDTPEMSDGVDRVESKEKCLPDGSRQVHEITHYLDGRQSVTTKKYRPGE